MFTIALIGEDGAGKTTIAEQLIENLPWPCQYLYMGLSVQSGNKPLPTTIVVRKIKSLMSRNVTSNEETVKNSQGMVDRQKKRGFLWLMARFLNRMAEIWWRQLISWIFQIRGYAVIYDRHFYFETALMASHTSKLELVFDRIEHWVVKNIYPKPDLVIVLDAPPEVLFQRKNEGGLEYLARRRKMTLEKSTELKHCVVVDASNILDQVISDVQAEILKFEASMNGKRAP